MKKVLIPTKLDKFVAEMLTEKGFSVTQDAKAPLSDLAKAHPDAEVLIVRSEKVTADIIDALPKLRLVVRAGAGYDNIDTKHARRRNVDVMNTPGANSNAVAEEVVALMLAAARKIVPADISTRAGGWEKNAFMGRELTGKTIGIVGLGNIGRLVVKRLEGFEMKFLAFDPALAPGLADEMGVELSSLEDIFAKSDYVTLHIPENPETKGIVSKRLLSLMKPGATLVNCARAGIINEADLREAKKERGIVFCNDVYPKDAEGPKSVADIADVMLPHLGASTHEANFNAAKRAGEQIIAYFDKGVSTCVVNKGVPDGLSEQFQTLANALTRAARAYLGESNPPFKVETSFYGKLNKYAKWLCAPIVAGLSPDFDIFLDAADAESFLKQRGIEYENRPVDESKKYGESMTIDLFAGDGKNIRKVSVRGTITENRLMISRINKFDKLYLEPSGHNLFVEYGDKPGVIGVIASVLGNNNINIIDIRAPQDLKLNMSIAAIKTNVPVPKNLVDEIGAKVSASRAFVFSYT